MSEAVETAVTTVMPESRATTSRKRWTVSQKISIVEESMQPGNSASRVARRHGISPALLYKWRKLMLGGGATAIQGDDAVVSMSEVKALKKRISELERTLGKKTLEIEILKAAVELGRKKVTIQSGRIFGLNPAFLDWLNAHLCSRLAL